MHDSVLVGICDGEMVGGGRPDYLRSLLVHHHDVDVSMTFNAWPLHKLYIHIHIYK